MTDKKLMKHCIEENAFSYNEIKEMCQEELDQVLSVCWHDSQFKGGCNKKSLRCYDRGITDLKCIDRKNHFIIEWEDFSGGPSVELKNLDEKIHMSGDGEWDYGLYKSENQVKIEKRDKKIQEIISFE